MQAQLNGKKQIMISREMAARQVKQCTGSTRKVFSPPHRRIFCAHRAGEVVLAKLPGTNVPMVSKTAEDF